VPKVAVQRAVDQYRTGGRAAFFVPTKPRPGRKLTPEVLPQVQARLDQGESVPEISRQTGVLANTIHKAIRTGRLRGLAKKKTLGSTP
jgi:DNA invertase Pin-like site-specific DNA recombinase